MSEKDKSFEETNNEIQESSLDVTELDDHDLEGASGGIFAPDEASDTNTNCHTC